MTEAPRKDLLFTPSSFGGGWLEALTSQGLHWAQSYWETEPYYLPPINGEGWLVEPYELGGLREAVEASGLSLSLPA